MYYDLFNLLSTYIYGAEVVLTNDQIMTLSVVSTIGVLFIVAIPFLVVWRVIKLFV